jgi:hypothetical protein
MLALITGHPDLSDWSFLLALAGFLAALALTVLSARHRPADDSTAVPGGSLIAPCILSGLALLAFGLLVL